MALVPVSARAGEWIQVSCVNPNGTIAPSQGWTGFTTGVASGPTVSTACAPHTPMTASLSDDVPAPVFTSAGLVYTSPPGSTLVGGTLTALLSGDGTGTDAVGDAEIDEPAQSPADARLRCAAGAPACSTAGADFSGVFTLPRELGGDLYVTASCAGTGGASCGGAGRYGTWALAEVSAADLLLQNNSRPAASAIHGDLLGRHVHGTVRLGLTATDPDGPGVYRVSVMIDGRTVSHATPNRNGGACVAVGTDTSNGAWEFDEQQPCPPRVAATLRVATADLPDGNHRLQVVVTDAAGNQATVLTRTITTANPQLTPRPRHGLRARFALSWRWSQAGTELLGLVATDVPTAATVAISCTGPHCPSLPNGATTLARLRAAVRGRDFRPGDRLLLTVSVHGQRPERIALTIVSGVRPRVRLLASR